MMLAVQIGDPRTPDRGFQVEVRPNCSMSPRNLAVTVICLAVVCLAIGLGFFSLGLWLVLPFAGLEIFVIGIAVGYTIRRAGVWESIVVDTTDVIVTKYEQKAVRQRSFPRYWARVSLEPGASRLQPNRLKIGSHGQFVEIGKDITDEARRELYARLEQALRAVE